MLRHKQQRHRASYCRQSCSRNSFAKASLWNRTIPSVSHKAGQKLCHFCSYYNHRYPPYTDFIYHLVLCLNLRPHWTLSQGGKVTCSSPQESFFPLFQRQLHAWKEANPVSHLCLLPIIGKQYSQVHIPTKSCLGHLLHIKSVPNST